MKKIIISFIVLCSITILFSYLHHTILGIEDMQIEAYSKILSKKQLANLASHESQFPTKYIITTLISFLIKILVISMIIITGFYLFNIKLSFKKVLQVIIYGEFVFVFVIVYEIIYFKFININHTFEDIDYYFPLSVLNIVGHKKTESYFIYPLQVLNFFEIIYILLITYFIKKSTKSSFIDTLKIVATSYGSALLLWVVVVMFFTLNYS